MPKAKKKSSKKALKSNSGKAQKNSPKNQTQHIRKECEEILKKEYPKSVAFNDLGDMVDLNCRKAGGEYKRKSITAQFAIVVGNKPDEFGKHRDKDAGMIYYYTGGEQASVSDDSSSVKMNASSKHKEGDFYPSFAEFLEYTKSGNDSTQRLNECTKAVAWGGNKSGGKWGTPDVVGVFRPARQAHVKFPDEIVSAEIKIDKMALITAFGQACAYRLFSHKVYLVVPETGQDSRLKTLCHLFGIGLVYFDPEVKKIDSSIYRKELRAQSHSPDMFYVNDFISGDLADELYGKH